MMKYRAYDKLTDKRYMVWSIDFKFRKTQLLPPGAECNKRYIRLFEQVVFERFTKYIDSTQKEIYFGDLLQDKVSKAVFTIAENLLLYNNTFGVVGYLFEVDLGKLNVIGQEDLKK